MATIVTPTPTMKSKPCAACGKDASKECTGCRRVAYCNRSCQKSHWKQHKKLCFPPGAKCTRCGQIIDENNIDKCNVPHPVHLSVDQGSMFGGGGGYQWMFSCEACGGSYTKSSDVFDVSAAPITAGAKFCYSGPHTIKPLPESDQRRVSTDVLVINSGPDCQREIDNIPTTMPDVRVLTIRGTGGYDEDGDMKLEVSLPKLKTLKLIDVCFGKLKLNNELTPSLEELYMQNLGDECKCEAKLPNLRNFECHYYSPDGANSMWIHEMLSTATKLERFDTYKLRPLGAPELHFAGNELRYIRLHRAELLESLSIYAPKLDSLSVQACYGLNGHLKILDTHPNFTRPPGRPSTFVVDATNACLSRCFRHTLENNPRIVYEDNDSDDDYY